MFSPYLLAVLDSTSTMLPVVRQLKSGIVTSHPTNRCKKLGIKCCYTYYQKNYMKHASIRTQFITYQKNYSIHITNMSKIYSIHKSTIPKNYFIHINHTNIVASLIPCKSSIQREKIHQYQLYMDELGFQMELPRFETITKHTRSTFKNYIHRYTYFTPSTSISP
jgi:hypothetical protein